MIYCLQCLLKLIVKKKHKIRKSEEVLFLGGEPVVISPSTVASQESTSSEEEVKEGLRKISKKSLFPIPLMGIHG